MRRITVWFPLFIGIHESRLKYVMNPIEIDYEPIKQVTQCENYRQVRSVLKATNQPHFDDLVHAQEVLAKKSITRDYGIRFKYTAFPSYQKMPGSFSKNIVFSTDVVKKKSWSTRKN